MVRLYFLTSLIEDEVTTLSFASGSEHSIEDLTMTNDELAAIVGLARENSSRERTQSFFELLEQTRYRALRPQLSIVVLQRYLKEHPEHLEEWERYSEDKRSSEGSYLSRLGPLWEVGELTPRRRQFFLSRSRACATFILRELDMLATYL